MSRSLLMDDKKVEKARERAHRLATRAKDLQRFI